MHLSSSCQPNRAPGGIAKWSGGLALDTIPLGGLLVPGILGAVYTSKLVVVLGFPNHQQYGLPPPESNVSSQF